jgi:hypothetical protein
MEVLMNRFIASTLTGALALALGLGTMGCQGESGPTTPKDKGIEDAKKAGAKMGEMQQKMMKAKGTGGAAPAAGDEDEKEKPKEKAKEGEKK